MYDPEELIPRVEVLGPAKDGFIMLCCLNATKERHLCVNAWCTNCSMALGGIKKSKRRRGPAEDMICPDCKVKVVGVMNKDYFMEWFRCAHAERMKKEGGGFNLPLMCKGCKLRIVLDKKK